MGLSSNNDTEIGKLVLDLGLATRQEIDAAREHQKQASDPNQRSLADLLIEAGHITVSQAKRLRGKLDEKKGSQIPGYRVMELVGKGAMAKVYMGKQLSLDRIVAIKVLPHKMSSNPEFIERFYKEGRAAARLSHNNIVQAIDVGETVDGIYYFVMEFVEGKTLYDIMQPPPVGEGRNFTETEAIEITIQIADALEHAHRRGLIHRDVKPKNILLTSHGVAKLTDLGLARDVEDKQAAETEAGKAYGTPYYISPEQIRGEVDIDHRADIYSLGATMYHLVTGRPPFDGETPSSVMHKHLKETLVPPDHINHELSAGVSEIIEYSMSKTRDERYQTMDDMLEDLRHVKRGEPPVHARKIVDFESLAHIEQSANTVDLEPAQLLPSPFANPAVIAILAIAGVSVLANLVLVAVMLSK